MPQSQFSQFIFFSFFKTTRFTLLILWWYFDWRWQFWTHLFGGLPLGMWSFIIFRNILSCISSTSWYHCFLLCLINLVISCIQHCVIDLNVDISVILPSCSVLNVSILVLDLFVLVALSHPIYSYLVFHFCMLISPNHISPVTWQYSSFKYLTLYFLN